MLTFPDFKEKRILLINCEYGADHLLQLTNGNIRFIRNGEEVDRMSCHSVFAIFIIGDMSVTTSLLKKLVSCGISTIFLNHNLSTKAAVMAEAEGNYLLRQCQYGEVETTTIATKIVANKLDSQETILKKLKNPYNADIFTKAREQLGLSPDLQQLLGIEGSCGKEYFQSIFKEFGWIRRAPQTREDITNLLLDIGYTHLFNFCDALLRLFGFDVYKGYYHQLYFQRKSLACDVMESMRPLIDQVLIKSWHLGQIKEKDFVFKNRRYDFKNGYKTAKIYSSLFLEEITGRREDIYQYILYFYRHIMDGEKYPFPVFKI